MVAWRYRISLLTFNSISHSFAALTHEILSWPPKEKFHISVRPCIIHSISFKLNHIFYNSPSLSFSTFQKKLAVAKIIIYYNNTLEGGGRGACGIIRRGRFQPYSVPWYNESLTYHIWPRTIGGRLDLRKYFFACSPVEW